MADQFELERNCAALALRYGLGADESFSVLEVAELFGASVRMIPNQPGNRLDAPLDTAASRSLGWTPRRKLADYIAAQKRK